MKTEIRQIAFQQGREIVKGYAVDNGTPELGTICHGCEKETAVVVDYSGGSFCSACQFHDLKECQARWGTITDYAYQALSVKYNWFNTDTTHKRIDRTVYDGVFAGINSELFTVTVDTLIKAGN